MDSHWSVGRRSRDDDLLGTSLQVGAGLVNGGEDTSRLNDVVSTGLAPLDVGGVTLAIDVNGLVVDVKLAVLLLNGALESTVHRVVLEHVNHVLEIDEGAKEMSAMPDSLHKTGLTR